MRFSIFALAGALGLASATVPSDLSSGFDKSYQMQMNHGQDISQGYDGKKYDQSQTMYQPSYGLKDYSKVKQEDKFVIVVVDTTDSSKRYMHYVHHDYQMSDDKKHMYSPSTAKQGWWAPGYLGQSGKGRSYTHLMYRQPQNFQWHNMNKLGDEMDMKKFESDCGFDKAITGITITVDVSSSGSDYKSYNNYRNSYDNKGNYGSYWNYMNKYNNYNQGYNKQGQYGNQYQMGYNQYQYMGYNKGQYTTWAQSSTSSYQQQSSSSSYQQQSTTQSVSYSTYAASSSGKQYYTWKSKTYTNYQQYTSYMASMGYSNPSVVMPASYTGGAVAGGAPSSTSTQPAAQEAAVTSPSTQQPPFPSTASPSNGAAQSTNGVVAAASASASPLVGAGSTLRTNAWVGFAGVAGFFALL